MIMYVVWNSRLQAYLGLTKEWVTDVNQAMLYRSNRIQLTSPTLEYVPVKVTRSVELVYGGAA